VIYIIHTILKEFNYVGVVQELNNNIETLRDALRQVDSIEAVSVVTLFKFTISFSRLPAPLMSIQHLKY